MKSFRTRPGHCTWDVLPRWVPLVLNCGAPAFLGVVTCQKHSAELRAAGVEPLADATGMDAVRVVSDWEWKEFAIAEGGQCIWSLTHAGLCLQAALDGRIYCDRHAAADRKEYAPGEYDESMVTVEGYRLELERLDRHFGLHRSAVTP